MASPRKSSNAKRVAVSPKNPSPLRNINPNIQAPSTTTLDKTPKWANPKNIMAKHKARRTLVLEPSDKSSKRARTGESENDSGLDSERSTDSGDVRTKTLSNPFTRQTKAAGRSEGSDIYSGSLSHALSDAIEISPLVEHLRQKETTKLRGPTVETFLDTRTNNKLPSEEKKYYITYKEYFDWSLKTTLRITTKAELTFIRDLSAKDCVFASSNSKVHSQGARFLRHLTYFTFPVLHGVRTFPRTALASPLGELHMDWKNLMPSLEQSWDVAIKELLVAVQLDLCPFFYIVTHQWNAVILANQIDQSPGIRAYIGPTNLGFRTMLKEKKIRFSMPLRPPKPGSLEKEQDELNSSGGSDSLTDSKGTNWITEQCKTVGKIFIADAVDVTEHELDDKTESLVALHGDEVETFVEALVKSKGLIPVGGPLLNVPPTLIAPMAFTCSTMERLAHRFCRMDAKTYLEVSGGPILPHVIPALVHIMTEDGTCARDTDNVLFSTHDGSVALTRITTPAERPNYHINPESASIKFSDVVFLKPAAGKRRQPQLNGNSGSLVEPEVVNLIRSFPLID